MPKLPLTSVIEKIEANWKLIIKEKFSIDITEEFLKNLTNIWFYLVNNIGLPSSLDKCNDLLIRLLVMKQPPTLTLP